ncbi:MAG TPA: hypothetical protein LFV92_07810 [Rickettsia endosymbiont of Ceroptres masudai]|nr:hypothetical protein [Rickettsia endosymbiont of Ceroptres masudai]
MSGNGGGGGGVTGGFDGIISGNGKVGTTSGKELLKLIAANVTSCFLPDEALLFGILSPANTSPVTMIKILMIWLLLA